MPVFFTEKYFIGVDLGTGSTKAVALNESGQVLHTTQYHYTTFQPQSGFSEQNPELIWNAFVSCLYDMTDYFVAAPAAISFSSAMHSILPVDAAGNALANAMLWSDARSGDIAADLRVSPDGEAIYHHTGTAVYAMSPLCKLIWLRRNQPVLFASAHKFISIKEFIWFRLFGEFEVDHSIASATGMLDILALQWYERSLTVAGISADRLSKPVSTTFFRLLTETRDALPELVTAIPFVIGASDGCCANLGGNAIRPGVAALTIGTSGAIRIGSSKPAYNYSAMTFNYVLNEQTFICGGAVNNGGAAVDWLLKSFLNTDVSENAYKHLFAAIATVPAGSKGLVFLPYLYAERAPVWDAKSSGAFVGINSKHEQVHFLRAALEGICFALNDVLTAVEESGGHVNEIVVSGGFISSPVWVQMLANITGKRLLLLQGGDSSAIGAAYLAMQALKIDIQPILQAESEKYTTVEPDADDHQLYKNIFSVYKKLYTNLKESMHQLNALKL